MPEIAMHAVESSNLAAIGYDEQDQILEVHFRNGARWRYAEVPLDVYRQMQEARRPGQAFHALVRNGGFRAWRVEDGERKPDGPAPDQDADPSAKDVGIAPDRE